MSLRDDLTTYISQQLMHGGTPLAPDASLIEAGVLDSVGLMNLLLYVETRAGVRIPDAEVTSQNFETVAAIEQLVARLRGSS